VVLENCNLDQVIEISAKAASQIGSDTNLIIGEKMTVRNLLNCLLIMSGNDSAYALGENYPGGLEKFVDKMNEKALALGMKNTHYLDPAGLAADAYSSAYDLSIITRYALKNKTFAEIVATPEITVNNTTGTRHHDLKNSNRLVNDYAYPGAIGVKTGYIPEAGHCLVGAAERDGHRLIAVVLNTNSDLATASATEARKLLDFGFNNFVFN
jgi:D-alanyl-D-alanine carboxypeptidase (penicillin-binding protein 5/6)